MVAATAASRGRSRGGGSAATPGDPHSSPPRRVPPRREGKAFQRVVGACRSERETGLHLTPGRCGECRFPGGGDPPQRRRPGPGECALPHRSGQAGGKYIFNRSQQEIDIEGLLCLIDGAVALLFCGYIGYDWARANQIPKTVDNAIDSAAALYMDIINLFLRILRIMGRSRRS